MHSSSSVGSHTHSILGALDSTVQINSPVTSLSINRHRAITVTHALLGSPRLVLLSRPATTLSIVRSTRILTCVGQLHSRNQSIIVIYRSLPSIFTMSSHVIIVHRKRIANIRQAIRASCRRVVTRVTNIAARRRCRRVTRGPGFSSVIERQGLVSHAVDTTIDRNANRSSPLSWHPITKTTSSTRDRINNASRTNILTNNNNSSLNVTTMNTTFRRALMIMTNQLRRGITSNRRATTSRGRIQVRRNKSYNRHTTGPFTSLTRYMRTRRITFLNNLKSRQTFRLNSITTARLRRALNVLQAATRNKLNRILRQDTQNMTLNTTTRTTTTIITIQSRQRITRFNNRTRKTTMRLAISRSNTTRTNTRNRNSRIKTTLTNAIRMFTPTNTINIILSGSQRDVISRHTSILKRIMISPNQSINKRNRHLTINTRITNDKSTSNLSVNISNNRDLTMRLNSILISNINVRQHKSTPTLSSTVIFVTSNNNSLDSSSVGNRHNRNLLLRNLYNMQSDRGDGRLP